VLKSLLGSTVYDSLKQPLLVMEEYVVKLKIMLPVILKIFKFAFNMLNFISILICTSGDTNLL